MDEPGEAFPTLLPLGGLLLAAGLWAWTRITAVREAARYERSR